MLRLGTTSLVLGKPKFVTLADVICSAGRLGAKYHILFFSN